LTAFGRIALSFFVGLLFAAGLGISGMTQPEKVLSFLDLFGQWDPSLAFVMMGAVGTYFVFFRILRGRALDLPTTTRIDGRLLGGALLFGIGWGLAGFCPGPALVSLGSAAPKAFLFVAAMVAGMGLWRAVARQ
jgi:uncharacterized membrane protein YedE/YeeE